MLKSERGLDRFLSSALHLSRGTKRIVMLSADVVMIPLALWSAVSLQAARPAPLDAGLLFFLATALFFSVPVFVRLGLYRAVVRFMGTRAVMAVVKGVTISALFVAGIAVAAKFESIGLSTAVIYWALATLYVGGSRFFARYLLRMNDQPRERVAIYGAGEAGARLAAALLGGRGFTPAVFVDDSRVLQGSVINGIEVRSPMELPSLVQDLEITRVLLAVPSVSRRRRQKILKRLESLAVRVQTMPDISDLISGRARVDEIREVDVADLLGRDPVPPNVKLLDACIRDKNVLVTGAGGSIGSELCRQIIELSPERLVLFEISELALYTVHKELRLIAEREGLEVEIIPLIGSVHHKARVREILNSFSVDTVYHAAAYKHVPIVEENMVEGIYNNVYGTWNAAEAALETGVETFVLVSTDKAVSPPNVMGATKRLAELVLQGLHERGSGTRFCMVRFGNVLASSGSVVPLFREQIKRGGPVTVTHPEIIRYFMTIPEAAQLVLQAGSMAEGGDVFVLDMGKPVRIADLARRMIHLMGLTVRDDDAPDGDIEILYTGLRPAEKLYEELLIGDNVAGTEHPRIMRAVEDSLPWLEMERLLARLLAACRQFDCEAARALLREAVDGYSPSSAIRDLVHDKNAKSVGERAKRGAVQDKVANALVEKGAAKVTSITTRRASE